MKRYRWPGNVRELGNAIERAVILAESSAITPELLGIDYKDIQQQTLQDSTQEELSLKEYFSRFVLENQDDMTETELARKLGISRKCLWERRQRYGLARKKA
jgi:DNA-binding NtrC family response regulator